MQKQPYITKLKRQFLRKKENKTKVQVEVEYFFERLLLRERERLERFERFDTFECFECLDCEEERREVERERREAFSSLLVVIEEIRFGFLVIQNFKANISSALKASPGVT